MLFARDIILITLEKKHNAVIDCELLSKVYINLLDQEPKFELKIDKDFTDLSNINNSNNYSKKIVKPTENETLLHKVTQKIKKKFFLIVSLVVQFFKIYFFFKYYFWKS